MKKISGIGRTKWNRENRSGKGRKWVKQSEKRDRIGREIGGLQTKKEWNRE